MLTKSQRETILAKMMQAVDAEVCQAFSNIETGELVTLWREAAQRQLDEAETVDSLE